MSQVNRRRTFGSLGLEQLEMRDVPATFTVNNPFDIAAPGQMNLRQAINAANAPPAAPDTIQFAAAMYGAGGGTANNLVNSTLPTISDDLTIDGTSGANGGGIAVTNTSLEMNNGTQVTSNTAGFGGGGIAAFTDGYVGIPLVNFVKLDGTGAGGPVVVNNNTANSGDGGGVLVQELSAGVLPDVIFNTANVTGNTARGTAPPPGGAWTSGRGGGVAAVGTFTVDSDTNTNVTGNQQSAPAPVTAPFKLGVYLDPSLTIFSTFPTNANVAANTQLP